MTKSKSPINFLDPSTLRIVDEPYKDGRSIPVSKYRTNLFPPSAEPAHGVPERFSQPPICPASQLAGKKGHKEPIVRARERCDDGEGGVWWIRRSGKAKDRLARPGEKSSMSTLLDYLNPALKRMPTAGSGSLD